MRHTVILTSKTRQHVMLLFLASIILMITPFGAYSELSNNLVSVPGYSYTQVKITTEDKPINFYGLVGDYLNVFSKKNRGVYGKYNLTTDVIENYTVYDGENAINIFVYMFTLAEEQKLIGRSFNLYPSPDSYFVASINSQGKLEDEILIAQRDYRDWQFLDQQQLLVGIRHATIPLDKLVIGYDVLDVYNSNMMLTIESPLLDDDYCYIVSQLTSYDKKIYAACTAYTRTESKQTQSNPIIELWQFFQDPQEQVEQRFHYLSGNKGVLMEIDIESGKALVIPSMTVSGKYGATSRTVQLKDNIIEVEFDIHDYIYPPGPGGSTEYILENERVKKVYILK